MNLKEYLFRNNMTIVQLAQKTGANYNYLSSIVGGRAPGKKLALKIVEVTNGQVTLNDLFCNERVQDK